jgi:hypothetical protein
MQKYHRRQPYLSCCLFPPASQSAEGSCSSSSSSRKSRKPFCSEEFVPCLASCTCRRRLLLLLPFCCLSSNGMKGNDSWRRKEGRKEGKKERRKEGRKGGGRNRASEREGPLLLPLLATLRPPPLHLLPRCMRDAILLIGETLTNTPHLAKIPAKLRTN